MVSKGLILAGGMGTRLWPLTSSVNKHLLPVFDKPMIYYALSNLMLAGIRRVGLVTRESDLELFRALFGDGSRLGIEITYVVQDSPKGIVDGIENASGFIGTERILVHLGDNFFFGSGVIEILGRGMLGEVGASVFTYRVQDTNRFGIAEFDSDRLMRLVEKPNSTDSNWALTGAYVLDGEALELSKQVLVSDRGEREIVDLLNLYLRLDQLQHHTLPRGAAWMDLGTLDDFRRASTLVETIQSRQGLLIGSPEEIAVSKGWASAKDVLSGIPEFAKSDYVESLKSVIKT